MTVEFFPDTTIQTIIRNTDGKKVVYRGQEAWFHVEDPSFDDVFGGTGGGVQGIAKVLIGSAHVFPNLEENTLIVVEGEDFLVGDWKTPIDGGVIYIALKTSTRT
jgi:hypothetical protein